MKLFESDVATRTREELGPGACLLRGFGMDAANQIVLAVANVAEQSPFRNMTTPGGFRMSVAMTNCGSYGWVTDRTGYRYDGIDPMSGQPWPQMAEVLLRLACTAATEAGFPEFVPDSCLINRYEPGAKMSLHQDKNELDFGAPIVSLSLGLPAVFLFGGEQRANKAARIRLEHGDIVVWGGPARLRYHGILPLKDGIHELVGPYRLNLTFRKAR